MILRKETETRLALNVSLAFKKFIRMNDTPQGDGNTKISMKEL